MRVWNPKDPVALPPPSSRGMKRWDHGPGHRVRRPAGHGQSSDKISAGVGLEGLGRPPRPSSRGMKGKHRRAWPSRPTAGWSRAVRIRRARVWDLKDLAAPSLVLKEHEGVDHGPGHRVRRPAGHGQREDKTAAGVGLEGPGRAPLVLKGHEGGGPVALAIASDGWNWSRAVTIRRARVWDMKDPARTPPLVLKAGTKG